MARVNGLGRLMPTPALNKIMLHRAAGGLDDPYLDCTHCIHIMNPQQSQSVSHGAKFMAKLLTDFASWALRDEPARERRGPRSARGRARLLYNTTMHLICGACARRSVVHTQAESSAHPQQRVTTGAYGHHVVALLCVVRRASAGLLHGSRPGGRRQRRLGLGDHTHTDSGATSAGL